MKGEGETLRRERNSGDSSANERSTLMAVAAHCDLAIAAIPVNMHQPTLVTLAELLSSLDSTTRLFGSTMTCTVQSGSKQLAPGPTDALKRLTPRASSFAAVIVFARESLGSALIKIWKGGALPLPMFAP